MASGASAQTVNLVPNPSLETASGSSPLSWATGQWGTNTTTFTYLTGGHTGSKSIKVQTTKYTSGDAKWYYTLQTVPPGVVYNVSDYYESNIVSHFMIQFQLASGAYQYIELATAPASSTAWKQYTGTVTAPANAVNMTIFHLISAVGWLTTDDYSVTTTTPPTTGSIKVTKTAVNGNGTFNFTGSTGISAFSITTASGTGNYTVSNLTPGTYTVTEGTLASGWAKTADTCGSVTVTAGNTATCTVTNTYTAPPTTGSIKVTKTAVNGNGTFNFTGSTGISAFAITTAGGTGSNTITGLTPGTYTITEGALGTGWAKTADTCSSVVVTAGNTATCTVTNTYTAPPTTGSITVTKTAVNGNGTFNFTGSTGISAFSITTAGGTGNNTITGLTPGTYTITEGTLGTGWAQTSTTCGSVTVTAGNTANCTVTNTYTAPPTTGSIKVTKTAVNGNGTFNFTGSTGIFAFAITTSGGTGSNTITNLTPGTYTITEGTLGTGWAQTSTTCSSVTVTAGNTAACTVTNTYTAPTGTGSIKVTKTSVNGDGIFNFTGSNGISAFSITTIGGTGSYTISNLAPGTYAITEGALGTGWAKTTDTCGSVVVAANSTAACGVTNTYTPVYTVTGTNVVLNPSAETASGSAPANWSTDNWGTNTTTFTYLTNSGHTGTHSLKVQTTKYTDGDAKWASSPIAVTSGDTYDFSDWYQSNTVTHVVIDFTNTDGTDYYLELRTAPVASTWTKYEESFQVPYLAKTMTIFHLIEAVGTLTTDDYSLIKFTPQGFSRPIVTLTFDNGFEDNITTAIPTLDQYGIKVSYCFSTEYVEGQPGQVAIVQAIANDGQEVCSHSVHHSDMTVEDPTTLTYELTHSQSYLQGLTGQKVDNFLTPLGEYNDAVLNGIKLYYRSHRPTDEGFNTKENFDQYRLKVVNMMPTTTLAQFQSWVNQAIKDKSWLVIVYHQIVPAGGTFQDFDTPQADFKPQLDVLKNSGVAIETWDNALNELLPQMGH